MISLVVARQEDQVITNILSLIVSILYCKREREKRGRERERGKEEKEVEFVSKKWTFCKPRTLHTLH